MDSAHFEIIYDAKQHELARIYLATAEYVHNEMLGDFQGGPPKTYLVLMDRTDLSNGAATVFPEPTIFLYPSPPEPSDSIYNHPSWAYLLLKHEYTHILNMYPSNGIPGIFRWIFGAWARPNMFLPNWYKEGIAVDLESEGKRFGRIHSEWVLGWLRASVLSGDWEKERLDRINSFFVPKYPYGSRPYYFGAFVWDYLSRNYGQELYDQLNQAYSRRVPFFIEDPVEKTTQKNYTAIFAETKNYWQEKVKRESFQRNPPGQSLGLKGYDQKGLSRRGQQALYISKNQQHESELRLVQFTSPSSWEIASDTVLDSSEAIHSAVFYQDQIYYDKIRTWKRRNKYSDIYVYDLKTKKSESLTQGARAKNVAVSNTGDVYWIQREQGVQTLRDSKSQGSLYSSELDESLHSLIWQEGKLYFLHKQRGGIHRILQYDPQKQTSKTLFSSLRNLYSLKACGKNLCISLSQNLYANLYYFNIKDKSFRKLTDTKTMIFDGFISKPHVIASEMTSDGLQYVTLPLRKPQKKLLSEQQKTPWKVKLLNNDAKEKNYSSTSHLLPKYWIPFYAYDANGSFFQISTGSNDPVNLQSYNLGLSYYTASSEWDQNFFYQNTYWDIRWFLRANRIYDYVQAADDTIDQELYQFGLGHFIYGLSNSWTWDLSAERKTATYLGASKNKALGASFNLNYQDFDKMKAGAILPENGNSLLLGHSHYIDDEDYVSYDISRLHFRNYFSYFLPEKHVLTTQFLSRYSDDNERPIGMGTLNIGGPLFSIDTANTYALRGYPVANFIAYSAANLRMTYTFPMYDIYRGKRSLPYFLRHFYINLLYEGLSIDGFYYDRNENLVSERHSDIFSSYGIELKLAAEIFYLMPVNFVLGIYSGDSKEAAADTFSIINIEVPTFL